MNRQPRDTVPYTDTDMQEGQVRSRVALEWTAFPIRQYSHCRCNFMWTWNRSFSLAIQLVSLNVEWNTLCVKRIDITENLIHIHFSLRFPKAHSQGTALNALWQKFCTIYVVRKFILKQKDENLTESPIKFRPVMWMASNRLEKRDRERKKKEDRKKVKRTF